MACISPSLVMYGKSHFTTIGAREKIKLCVQPQGNSFLR